MSGCLLALVRRVVCDTRVSCCLWHTCVVLFVAHVCRVVCGTRVSPTCGIPCALSSTMRWLRLVASIKLYVSFAECILFYSALLQKRRIIESILLTVALTSLHQRSSNFLKRCVTQMSTSDARCRKRCRHLSFNLHPSDNPFLLLGTASPARWECLYSQPSV